MTDALTMQLERCYTGVLHDVMRAMGLRDFTLPPELRPILPAQAMAGPVFTIDGRVDPAADGHLIRSGVTLRLGHKLARRVQPGRTAPAPMMRERAMSDMRG